MLWESVSNWISSGNLKFDNHTFNLVESIACGVYQNGVLVKLYLMSPQKSVPKKYTYHGMRMNADGLRLARAVFEYRPAKSEGISIVFRCPLNYGFFVEHGLGPSTYAEGGNPSKKGYGWWSDGLVPYIKKELNNIFLLKNGDKRL